MRRTTTRMLQLTLTLVFAAFLVSCGSDSDEPVLVSVYSTQAYSGHGIAFSNNSTVTTSGANGFGQLGNGSYLNSAIPTKVRPPEGFTAVTAAVAGATHCVVLDNGAVWTWGYNIYGQLGNDSVNGSNIPVRAKGTDKIDLDGVKAIAAGGMHTLAVDANGTVLAWGQNSMGQLGMNNTTPSASVATPVTGVTQATAVAAGGEFSLALDSSGNVWAWGNNAYGQLGNGKTESSPSPAKVQTGIETPDPEDPNKTIITLIDLSNIVAIAAGGSHALAIDAAGNVWAWGYNYFGQLGTGDAVNRTSAVKVTTDGAAGKIAAGLAHSLVLTSTGLYSSGYNALGQLGLGGTVGTPPYALNFTRRLALEGVVSISANGHFSMARVGGKFYTWGDNAYGQLGVSGIFNTATPSPSGY